MERVKTFVNGGRFYPADINSIQDRAAEMLEGTAAAIPSSHYAGRYYRATDTGDLYLDNGTTWKKIAGKEAILDENIVKGRVLVETENSYSPQVERAAVTEYEPSATRPVYVSLQIELTKNESGASIFCGSQQTTLASATLTGTSSLNFPYSFPCPPKVKWHWTTIGAGVVVKSSYLIQ